MEDSRDYEKYAELLTATDRLYDPSAVLKSFDDPTIRGVYAWWFKDLPAFIPLTGTLRHRDFALAYVGTSERPLLARLREHLRGDASRSTLRRTLGCLLSEQLDLAFRVVRESRAGAHCHFGLGPTGEGILSNWIQRSALVSWVQYDEPSILERHLIRTLTLPLNVRGNNHPFACRIGELLRTQEANALANRHRPADVST